MEREMVDRYFQCKEVIENAKEVMKEIEVIAIREAAESMSSSKAKTYKYYGSGSNILSVQEAEKLDVISFEALKQFLNGDPDGIIEEKVTRRLSAKFTKIAKPFAAGKYVDRFLSDVLEELVKPLLDEKSYKVALKKIKGSYDKDFQYLCQLGIYGSTASEIAYLAEEAATYEKMVTLLRAWKPETTDVDAELRKLASLLMVDTTLKIGSESEESDV